MSVRRALTLTAITLGCAAAPSRAPRYCPTPRRELQSAPPPQGRPDRVEVVAASSDDGRATAEEQEAPACVPPDGRLAALEVQVADGLAAVMAPEADCRTACRSAGGVCAARDEICRLTGDEGAATPLDPRCVRARAACEDATRRRTDRCPVCPTE